MKKNVSNPLAITKKAPAKGGFLASNDAAKRVVVAHTGFEPVISSLRGTRPRPLDECAACYLSSSAFMAIFECARDAPAFRATATKMASAISSSVAPTCLARRVCPAMQ